MRQTLCALPLILSTALPALADQPATMLVLDASGSMWGQIDGVNKIVIARDVLGGLLDSLPADQALGLTVYGHRSRGDCGDIETLIAPAPGTRSAIAQAVAGLNPKGKTPLSAAVIEAARALRHTEEAATVILISDGIETCEADPCAVGAELEASGVNFTAHVVGFDVNDPVATAQLQCLAQNTGGRYLPASNAAELAEALTQVAAPPAPAPEPADLRLSLSARETFGTATRAVTVRWQITDAQGAEVGTGEGDSAVALDLPPGRYTVTATRLPDGAEQTASVTLTDAAQAVALTFEAPLPPATLSVSATTGAAGSALTVDWTGPDGPGDYLDTALPGAAPLAYATFTYTADGAPAQLRLPAQPGTYEIRYIEASSAQVLASLPVTVTPQQDGLTAPDSATIGATIAVGWQGGGFAEDYIDTALPGAEPLDYKTYAYVRDGNPVQLRLPLEPGTYELRYITGQDSSVAARRTITLTDIPVTLQAPAEAAAGSEIAVSWDGPGFAGDYLTIATPGDGPLGYVTYSYTAGGSPLRITAPETPGPYVLRYVAEGATSRVMAEVPLTIR